MRASFVPLLALALALTLDVHAALNGQTRIASGVAIPVTSRSAEARARSIMPS